MPKLLIIDDEPNLLYSLKKSLQTDTLEVITAATAERGIAAVRKQKPDAVILDLRLPDMSGLETFDAIHRIDARLPVIIITAFSTTETAIKATKRGAFEYLLKPVEFERLLTTVDRALETSHMSRVPAVFSLDDDNIAEPDSENTADLIVGRSESMQEVYKAIGQVAGQDVNVLILGESGTGKEMVARAIFQHSHRSQGPFLAINCAALPESLLESELFGHEKGSFTGADKRRIGKFEQVNGGTIFLDEIGDMTPATQSKILRLLQNGTFERVGSNETIQVDVRVIAATNRDLEAHVKAGDFREDLFYRLRVFLIELPALRDRRDDLRHLVEHFVRLGNRELGKNVSSISTETMDRIAQHSWPGNVRELQSAIKYALVRNVGDILVANSLPASCVSMPELVQEPDSDSTGTLDLESIRSCVAELLEKSQPEIYYHLHNEVDRILLPAVLNEVDGNQAQASELLGIARSTLRSKISDLGLTVKKGVAPDSNRKM
ncbi:sigma-54-dependent transcriptional regulator [Mariniblastus fucicola]|uniref:DNA-binding transcriptional regulator NtrC n=1 Tax=Mariniblastus fucicola TaxID=980251 RepID=A0A5B9PJR7_9BACT|nr:sigma-54 dependent transcriptional regulator [Mariniblastus fucicola]QEG24916.1 Nitrogen assimilation regulatory protein [Mariniblastus fucicola]